MQVFSEAYLDEVVELLPVAFMFEGYPGLHDFDLWVAVRKVGEQCGLKENVMSQGENEDDLLS